MIGDDYDEDYYERGIETGKSCYTNYRWIPELTIPMAMSYIDYLGLTQSHTILDFGCAKGYLVKALRLLHRQAWGCDISSYAVSCSDFDVKPYLEICNGSCVVPFDKEFDYIISKDVFEHFPEDKIFHVLTELRKRGKFIFAVIPLGKDGKYNISAYELDVTHQLAKDRDWWIVKFFEAGWKLVQFSYYVAGIKESWARHEKGNGFFLLKNGA